jgi:hypothetical protein
LLVVLSGMLLCSPHRPWTHDPAASVSCIAWLTGMQHCTWFLLLCCYHLYLCFCELGSDYTGFWSFLECTALVCSVCFPCVEYSFHR